MLTSACDGGNEASSDGTLANPASDRAAPVDAIDAPRGKSAEGNPTDLLTELGVVDRLVGETRVTSVNFVTLRDRTGSTVPADTYGDGRDVIRAGRCDVAFTPIRILDNIARDAPLYIPSDDEEIVGVTEMAMQTFWNEYVSDNTGQRPLLYVHGYNIGFDKGCFRAARFIENLALGRRVLLFSWPSDGFALNYMRDEADLHWSVKTLREVITRMEILFGRGNFDILGHSLGARGVALALSTLPRFDDHGDPLVDKLVLVAADIDADIFDQFLPLLRSQAKHITAYVSQNDNALALSRELHGYPRLGESGSHIVSLEGVEIIDVSELPLRRVSGHLYHLYNEPAFRDLDELLNGRLEARRRSALRIVDPTLPNYWRLPVPEDASAPAPGGG